MSLQGSNQNYLINSNQGHPIALGDLATHNNKEKHGRKCRYYKLMEEKRYSLT